MLDHLVPPPEGVTFPQYGTTAMLRAADGLTLRAAFWPAPEHETGPAGTVFILQGRTEFIEKYAEVIIELLARNFAVATLDWRGQGGSERQLRNARKGHVEDFDDYLLDLDALIAEAMARALPTPFHMLAHSMGGAIGLLALARGPSPFTRAVMSAPLTAIANLPAAGAARLLARVLNSLGLSGFYLPFTGSKSLFEKPFEANPLTSDPARYAIAAAWIAAEPALALGDPTIGWIDATFHVFDRFAQDDFGHQNRTPLLMLTAGRDMVVDSLAAEALAAKMRGASATRIPGSAHEILIERDVFRTQFWAAFDAFVPTQPASPT